LRFLVTRGRASLNKQGGLNFEGRMTLKGIEVWSALIGFTWIVLRLGADFIELGYELSVSAKDGKFYHCFVGYNLAKESTGRNRAIETSCQCSRYGIQIGEKVKS
jgi:hypothetical protein